MPNAVSIPEYLPPHQLTIISIDLGGGGGGGGDVPDCISCKDRLQVKVAVGRADAHRPGLLETPEYRPGAWLTPSAVCPGSGELLAAVVTRVTFVNPSGPGLSTTCVLSSTRSSPPLIRSDVCRLIINKHV